MRRIVYSGMVSAPSKVVSGAATLLGLAGTIWPEKVQNLAGDTVTVDNIQSIGIVLLIASVIYFALLWLLKPGESDSGKGNITQTTSGSNFHNIHAGTVGEMHLHAAPPPPAAKQIMRPANSVGERPHPRPQKIEGWGRPDKPHVSNLGELAKTESSVSRPDIPLNGFLGRIYKSLGGAPSDDAQKNLFYKRVNQEIADKVSLNNVNVWGYYGERPIQKIGKQSWDSGRFDHRQKTLSIQGDAVHPMIFRDLKFNKDEIDAIWPP